MSAELSQDLPPSSSSLSAQLETLLLVAISNLWRETNEERFQGRLRPPVFSFMDSSRRLGSWCPATRSLCINRTMALDYAWRFTQETLLHEMAHQYVSEIAKVQEAPHGPVFAQTCLKLGISPAASGSLDPSEPSGLRDQDDQSLKVIHKVKRLLALAQSPNRNEAENAAAMARSLMLKYNLEQSEARNEANGNYGYLHLGSPSRRIHEHQQRIASILANFFFVEVVLVPVYVPALGKYARVIEISGRRANLEMASYVHDFLLASATRLWDRHYIEAKLSSRRPRLTFMAGVMAGFYKRLASQDQDLGTEGLVAVQDPELLAYVARRHPRTQSTRSTGRRRTAEFEAGQKAGKEIVLNKPVQDKGSRSSGPRALPGAR